MDQQWVEPHALQPQQAPQPALEGHGQRSEEVALGRVAREIGIRLARDRGERYERKEFLERVDAEYARQDVIEVDATGTPEEVAKRVRTVVDPVVRRG